MMKSDQNKLGMGLYIHIPFCIKKCAYCDFYSVSSEGLHDKYIDALNIQMKNLSKLYSDRFFDTVYIGGGTPTILEKSALEKLLNAVPSYFNISADCEFTIEANPATLDENKLEVLLRGGVNRLSIGCQSAHDAELKILGRIHSFSDFVDTYHLSRKEGFKNISVDLMYAIPNQTAKSFIDSIESITELSPEHLSVYGLKVEPNTLFYKNRDILQFPDEDEYCQMYLDASELLARKGYNKYEVSNFSKNGFESRHNLKYWQMDDYLGLGPGAHSFVNGRRFAFSRDLVAYIDAVIANKEPPLSENSVISRNDLMSEEFMLNMRLTKGYSLDKGLPLDKNVLSTYEKYGYVVIEGNNIRFTDRGFLVSNYILSSLINFD